MIDSLAGYQSPSMISDTATRESLNAFITKVLQGFSTPASDVAKYFADSDVAIAGSGLDEFFMGDRSGTKWCDVGDHPEHPMGTTTGGVLDAR
ncbi:hypothetical protein ACPCYX_23905 [Pseudomonas fluorescens]|uniref:hypothetical protein n=1 Tax=Pseudomonas fluorescens TaxID=294 RepID=UPI003C2A1B08